MGTRHVHRTAATLIAAGLAAFQPELHAQADPAMQAASGAQVVEVIAEDYAFDAPDVIPSGWTTFRFRNRGEEPHMVFLARLPHGKTAEDYEVELSGAFAEVWYALRDGRVAGQDEALAMLGESLPEWFPALRFVGGPGLVAPGLTSDATLDLEPGNYVLECYVKTEDGEIHYMDGMTRPLIVAETRSGAAPPAADIRITLSNYEMAVEGDLAPGTRTIEVHVAENPEAGFGHSVHLARLDPGTEVDHVVRWMNWLEIDGYRAPAPARFLGGMHPMPAGHTAYFTVDLEPGRHLFVSEATGHQGVLHEFTVR